MEHKNFRVLSLSVLVIITALAGSYDYCVSKNFNVGVRLMLKVSPLFVLIILGFCYIFIYRVTLYSAGLLLSLFFCLIGDLFMGLYDPSLIDVNSNQIIYLLLSGGFFFLARVVFTIMFIIKPYIRMALVYYNRKKLILSHVICSVAFTILGIFNIVRDSKTISILVSVYIILGFGIPLSYSYLRIGALNDFEITESKTSCVFAFLGILFFNVSDLLLFICIFTDTFPSYVILIADNIYWLSMYLLTVSVVRSPYEYVEKGY